MIRQITYMIAALFLNISVISYSMNRPNIDPATRAILYTQAQINKLLKELKSQDETFIESNGRFRRVRKIGGITVVEPVRQEGVIPQAKL